MYGAVTAAMRDPLCLNYKLLCGRRRLRFASHTLETGKATTARSPIQDSQGGRRVDRANLTEAEVVL